MFHQYQPDPFDFGLCSGLIPVVGDVVDTSLSYFLIIRPARKCDIPVLLLERMLLSSFLTQIFLRASLLLLTLCSLSFLLYVRGNSDQAVSTSIGLVPLVGDIIVASVLAPYLFYFYFWNSAHFSPPSWSFWSGSGKSTLEMRRSLKTFW